MMKPWTLSLFLVLAQAFSYAADEAGIAFYRDEVYPILEAECFRCHGGEDKLKGEFRVTSREGLLRGAEYGPGYNEADPKQSIFLKMVHYESDEYQMPPKSKLPAEDLAILDKWFEMGVPYDPELEIKGDASEAHRGFAVTEADRQWWAYKPISDAAAPEPARSDWAINPIDKFVLSKLEAANLAPNDNAEPAALIRRVSYDVTGLPPTPEEVEAFVAASETDADAAYRELVDRLLASPRYGEKWARHWLDLVRYAESNGFERDNSKPQIWKYRDWVINAFNSDMPYDTFVTHQLAGDEIAEPTRDSLVATGYHRLMQWDDEPADRKQHVYDLLADNVQVTTETFLASTVGCARCHDHKADPFSAKDYYAFMAYFHGVTHYQTPGTIYNWSSEEERAAFATKKEAAVAKLQKEAQAIGDKIRAYLADENLIRRDGQIKAMTLIRDARKDNPTRWDYVTAPPTPDWKDVGFRDKSWHKGYGGFGNGNPPNHVTQTKWTTKEIWLRTTFGLKEIPAALTLDLYHDEDVEVYLNGVEILRRTGYIQNYQSFPLDEAAMAALQTGRNTLAIHCKQTGGGQYIDAGLRTPGATSDKLEDIIRTNGNQKLITQIKDHFKADLYNEYIGKRKQITEWDKNLAGEALNIVKEHNDSPAPLHVHLRGSAHALGEQVEPGTPAVLGPEGNEPIPSQVEKVSWSGGKSSGRRLALAQWITDDSNPLTARVMVNRIWQHHFGRGIVPSSSDFGELGERPTHPELLDWLAHQFIQSGWKIKDMHRLILNSRTYRMSSAPNSQNYETDPTNNLFWRNNMRRLTAEELRDTILTMSGKLEEKVGGPWVYPPLPQEVLATASQPGKGWPISKNEPDHYRRSVYIHVKRSLRHPMMADFDQADTDTACAVRFATTVPNQALMMLNSKFVNDHAKLLGQRLREMDGEIGDKVTRALQLVTQREPDAQDVQQCVELYEKLQSDAGVSESDALDRVALLALNLNEFIYLD